MQLQAHAKINLSLRVLGRRSDGFHEIDSLMVPIGIADVLEIELAPETRLTCSDESLPADDSNLVILALRALENAVGKPLPVRIHLEKRIPHGAGLGGGSSDAAALLRGANDLFGLGLGTGQLAEIAASIGSDIPFFLHGPACRCRGRGELVEPLDRFPRLRVLIAKPEFPVPTPWAYQRWAESRCLEGIPYDPVTLSWGEVVNDLERPVFEKYLVLADMKRWLALRPEVEAAGMSGSGSTMFAILRDDGIESDDLRSALAEEFGASLWIAETVTVRNT